MSFFAEPNVDAMTMSPSEIATGPRAGFLRSFETAYKTQVLGNSLFGVQSAMQDREDKQRQALRDAGEEDIPSISQQADAPLRSLTDFGQDYWDTAKYYQSGDVPAFYQDESSLRVGKRLELYDTKIAALKQKYPALGLQTSKEMFDSVKTEAQQYDQRARNDRQDLWGSIGSLAGGMVGGVNPNTDPLNFATLPIGGGGGSIVTRIAGQAGIQAAAETVNQFSGVQEQRRVLGLDSGFVNAAESVIGAGFGGAVGQGVGEALGFGLRKMFPHSPDPVPDLKLPEKAPLPAPDREGVVPEEPRAVAATYAARPQAFYDVMRQVNDNVVGNTRLGTARFVGDIEHAATQLDSWDGPPPWEMKPRTDTAPIQPVSDFTRQPDLKDVAFKGDLDGLARRVDPETMEKYDALAQQKQVFRDRLNGETAARDVGSDEKVKIYDAQLQQIDQKIAKASAKNRKKLGKQRDEIVQQRAAAAASVATTDTPNMSDLRGLLQHTDEQMRDLAPLVSRAYSVARGRWSATQPEREAINSMIRDARTTVEPTPDEQRILQAAMTPKIEDTIPMLMERPAGTKPDADAADVQMKVYEQRAELADERTEAFTANAQKMLKDDEAYKELSPQDKAKLTRAREPGELPPGEFKIDGYDSTLNLDDKIITVDEATGAEKTITVRDLLQQHLDAQEDLKAVQACSIR